MEFSSLATICVSSVDPSSGHSEGSCSRGERGRQRDIERNRERAGETGVETKEGERHRERGRDIDSMKTHDSSRNCEFNGSS